MSGRRKQDWSTRFSRKEFREDLASVLIDAHEAFWGVIQQHYRAAHGDLDPATVVDQYGQNQIAVLTWLKENGDDLVSNEALVFLKELRPR